MAANGPIGGLREWLVHRLVANYWSLPLVAVIVAPLLAGLGLYLDGQGLAPWMFAHGLVPVAAADTAQDLAITAAGIDAAFITLYFSIVLIVLTLAAGNLGMRLVDRWLDKALVRISMSGLAFCLVHALVVLMAIDPDAEVRDLPLFSISAMFVLQLVNLAMLGVAAHDLGRTMFVDRSVANLGAEAAKGGVPVVGGQAFAGDWGWCVEAPREGYVQGIGLERLADRLADCGRIRFCAAPGQHVLCGEPLVLAERAPSDPQMILEAIPIGDYRTNAENTVFHVRLLVEIGARALSPGINDFYTALACADRLACAIVGQAETWVDDGAMPLYARRTDFELPGQDFRGLFSDPLKAFRQAAAPYPSVAIRLIDNYARLYAMLGQPGLLAFLREQAADMAEHAIDRCEFDGDAEAIRSAMESFAKARPVLREAAE